MEFDLADPGGTRRELATASILQMSHVCVNTSAVDADCDVCGEVCLNTSAVVDAHFTGEGTVRQSNGRTCGRTGEGTILRRIITGANPNLPRGKR